jgi:hypothetical protein
MLDSESNLCKNMSTKPCIQCHEEIPVDAKKCSSCSGYQTNWKNELQYFSSVIGIPLAAIAIIPFSIKIGLEVRSTWFGQDHIDVLEYISSRRLTLTNSGDGSIFVSHISINAPDVRASLTWPVDMKIEKGSFVLKDESDPKVLDIFKTYSTVDELNDKEWNKALISSVWPQLSSSSKSCFTFDILAKSEPRLKQQEASLRLKGFKLRTFPVTTKVHYYSSSKKRIVAEDFPAVGILLRKPTLECAKASH